MKYAPYSYSKIETFNKCPLKFKLKYIDWIRIPQESKALEKGSFLHHLIECYLKYEPQNFEFKLSTPEDIENYHKIFENFLSTLKKYENKENIAIEQGFSIIKKDGKFKALKEYTRGDNVLISGFIDFMYMENGILYIIDWKSGKFREYQKTLQLKAYALWGFLYYDIDEIHTEYVFIEENKTDKKIFHRSEMKELAQELVQNIKMIENASDFKPNFTGLCDYCEYKGKHCKGEMPAVLM